MSETDAFSPWNAERREKCGCNQATWIKIGYVLFVFLVIDLTALYIIRSNRLAKASIVYEEVIPAEPTIILRPPTRIFVQVLFRSGATGETGEDHWYSDYMKNGTEHINERGSKNSELLGKFLKERYGDTGFINISDNTSVSWISPRKNYTMETATSVNRGFTGQNNISVIDEMTGYLMHQTLYCDQLIKEVYPSCDYNSFDLCSFGKRTDKKWKILEKHQIEANNYKNGRLSPLIDPDAAMNTVFEFESARGSFNDNRFVQLKYSGIIAKLLDSIINSWNSFQNSSLKVKLEAYSVEDWIILGLLHVSGFLDSFESDALPEWNSLWIYELWEMENRPVIKVFYKKYEVSTELIDYSLKIEGCEVIKGAGCTLESFINSFDVLRYQVEGCPENDLKPPTKSSVLVFAQVWIRPSDTEAEQYSDRLRTHQDSFREIDRKKAVALGQFLKQRYVGTSILNVSDSKRVSWIYENHYMPGEAAKVMNEIMFSNSMPGYDIDTGNKIHRRRICDALFSHQKKKYSPSCTEYDDPSFEKCVFIMETGMNDTKFDAHEKEAVNFKNGKSSGSSAVDAMETIALVESTLGYYDNKEYVRMMYSFAINIMLNNMNEGWDRYRRNGPMTSLNVYLVKCAKLRALRRICQKTVHDWVILMFLKISGFIEKIKPDTLPEWSSILIYELWEIDKKLVVKVFYKKDEVETNLIDYSLKVRGCEETKGAACTLESFIKSFDGYRDEEEGKTCGEFKPDD